MDQRPPAPGDVPAVRLASRLRLATTFIAPPPSSTRSGRRRSFRDPPPALTADVRVVIRRHFPAGPHGRIAEEVAEDIVLRRRPSRGLRDPERVEQVMAEELLPLVEHPFDRGAVAAGMERICAHVAAACAGQRADQGAARVLVVVDTFACPVVLRRGRPAVNKPMSNVARAAKSFIVRTSAADTCVESESTVPAAKTPEACGVIGDGRDKPVVEERFKGWVPW